MKTREIKYHTDKDFNSVFCGKREIARVYFNSKGTHVRILQGMPRNETIEKICSDCPDFAKINGIDENYYPLLFSK